jgi:hypothetical protein
MLTIEELRKTLAFQNTKLILLLLQTRYISLEKADELLKKTLAYATYNEATPTE